MSLCAGLSAHAASILTNGNFSQVTAGSSSNSLAPNGELGSYEVLTGWSSSGYNFVYTPGTADTKGMTSTYGTLNLWGLQNGAGTAQSASGNYLDMATPFTGNIVAADGAFSVGPITQSLTNLVVGDTYAVSFYYAGAQQYGSQYNSATTEQWVVSLGSQTQSTQVLQNGVHGFTGWYSQTFNFTVTSASETLSFLANGTPSGQPPFSLLGGVTMNDVTSQQQVAATPEMSTFGFLFTGLMTSAGAIRYRSRRMKA